MSQNFNIHEAAKFLNYKHPESLRRFLRKYPESIPHSRIGPGVNAPYIFVKARLEECVNKSSKVSRVRKSKESLCK